VVWCKRMLDLRVSMGAARTAALRSERRTVGCILRLEVDGVGLSKDG
jgi:hypothetical protein